MLLMPSPRGGLLGQIGWRLPDSERGSFDARRKRHLDFSGILAKSERELVAEQDEMHGFYKTRPR
jgi:hypothetical protein